MAPETKTLARWLSIVAVLMVAYIALSGQQVRVNPISREYSIPAAMVFEIQHLQVPEQQYFYGVPGHCILSIASHIKPAIGEGAKPAVDPSRTDVTFQEDRKVFTWVVNQPVNDVWNDILKQRIWAGKKR